MPMFDSEFRQYESAVQGALPAAWSGSIAPDGDAYPWLNAGLGSQYLQLSSPTNRIWQKVAAEGRDDDWAALAGMHVISRRITRAQMTDGGGTSGTFVLTQGIPQGAFVLRCTLLNVTGFTGNTSAVIVVGDGSDVDRYSLASAPSVFTTANAIDLGAPSGTQIHTAAATVTVTITGGTDFTNITAGALTLRIFYMI